MEAWRCVYMCTSMHAKKYRWSQKAAWRLELWLWGLTASTLTHWATFPAPVSYSRQEHEAQDFRGRTFNQIFRLSGVILSILFFFSYLFSVWGGVYTWRSQDSLWEECFSSFSMFVLEIRLMSRRLQVLHPLSHLTSWFGLIYLTISILVSLSVK